MSVHPTIAILRQEGYEVFISHYRPHPKSFTELSRYNALRRGLRPSDFLPTGGRTLVTIKPPEGVAVVGEAVCSDRDNFNKKMGLEIAFGRALKMLSDRETLHIEALQ